MELTGTILLTMDQVAALLPEWQEALRLRDWHVHVSIERLRDMGGHRAGCCTWLLSTRTADIKLLDPVDYPDVTWPYDMEQVLVHELLHLSLAGLSHEDDEPEWFDIAREQAIDSIAETLVALKRRS